MAGTFLKFQASFTQEEVEKLRQRARAGLELLGLAGAEAGVYFSVVDELCGNILEHGGASWVEIHMSREGEKVSLTFRDDGKPFDTVEAMKARGPEVLEKDGARGLGLYMVKRFADQCRYRRDGGVNETAFERKL